MIFEDLEEEGWRVDAMIDNRTREDERRRWWQWQPIVLKLEECMMR